jgi:hypothetical protein
VMGYFRKGHPGIFTLEKDLVQSPANRHRVVRTAEQEMPGRGRRQ